MTTATNVTAAEYRRYLLPDSVLLDPVLHDRVVQVVEELVDVSAAIRGEVHEVRVLVHVERDERRGVPDGERVLRVADVVEETALVPVVGRPRPPAPTHAGRLEVGLPVGDGAEVALHEVAEETAGVAAVSAQVLEVELVVL